MTTKQYLQQVKKTQIPAKLVWTHAGCLCVISPPAKDGWYSCCVFSRHDGGSTHFSRPNFKAAIFSCLRHASNTRKYSDRKRFTVAALKALLERL
jgi:hypothetical protein